MQGLDIYKTRDSFTVARLHYTADPDKSTPEAIAELAKGYPRGLSGPAWRKEMEIDFTAYSGQLLCYFILQQYHTKIIRDIQLPTLTNKYGSLDWGRNNPASFNVYSVFQNKHIHSTYEIYQRDLSLSKFSDLIKSCPHYKDLLWISADPSLWNKNQENKEGLRSLEEMFRDNGIHLIKGKSKDDTLAINELLDRWYELDKNEPRFTISPKCHKQIWEFERLRYKELTTAMLEKVNPHEQLIDKDNHSWDNFKYFISTWLTAPTITYTQKVEKGSVAYEMEQDERDAKAWRDKY